MALRTGLKTCPYGAARRVALYHCLHMGNERALEVHWFLPTGGDGSSVNDFFPDPARQTASARPATLSYMREIAQAADRLGFAGVLTPTGSHCEDAWVECAALAPATERLRFLVAFRPGFVLPTLAAQMAATLQEVSGGRALVNIVTGGDPAEQAKYGDFLDHDARYARTGEFLEVFQKAWAREAFDYDGAHYRVKDGGLNNGGRDVTMPLIYFGGASQAAEAIAAEHADVYLLWGEPPDWVAERIERMRRLAADADGSCASASGCTRSRASGRRMRGRRRTAAGDDVGGGYREGTGELRAHAVRRAAADDGAAWREDGLAGGGAEPVGGHRAGAGRCGDRPRREPRAGGGAHPGVRGAGDRYVHPFGVSAS